MAHNIIYLDQYQNDIQYLKEKLEQEQNLSAKERIQKQIELLDDAVIIYHEHRSAELDTLIDLFVQWWFGHNEDSHFFNEAVRQCPTLTTRVNKILKGEPNDQIKKK